MSEQHVGSIRDEAPLPGGLPLDTDLVEIYRPHNPSNPAAGGISYAGTWGELKSNITQGTSEFVTAALINNLNSLQTPGVYQVSSGPVAGLHATMSSGGTVLVLKSDTTIWQQYTGHATSGTAIHQYHRKHNGSTWSPWYTVPSTELT